MQMRVLWCLPLVMSAAWWTPSFAAGGDAASAAPALDARAWLERIRSAARERNYQGTMVSTAGDVVSSSRVGHFCVGDQSYERVEALDGRQQSIYRHNDLIHTLWPTRRVATIERREAIDDAMGLPEIDLRLREQYDVHMLATDRLAGREAHVLMLAPRDGQRFAQRFWADAATGLMLRADTLATNGSVLESVAFSDVEIGLKPQRDSVLGPMKKLDGYRVATLQPVPTKLEAEGWAVGKLPTGFRLLGCVRRGIGDPIELVTAARPSSDALQAVFSDGLARVSVFIEALDPARPRQPLMTQMGATHTVMRQHLDRWWVTVMGDVPPATLRQFLTALERRP